MLPKRDLHDHKRIQQLRPVRLVDLRDYGLEKAAPSEDGHKVLVFRLCNNGALMPVS